MTSLRAQTSNRIDQLVRSLERLEEALRVPESDLVRDACIQRFEFTFEMAWKAVQALAFDEGQECTSPRDCLRAAFRMRLISDEPLWMAMVEDRNRTSHTYDEQASVAIYQALPRYAALFRALLGTITSRFPSSPGL